MICAHRVFTRVQANALRDSLFCVATVQSHKLNVHKISILDICVYIYVHSTCGILAGFVVKPAHFVTVTTVHASAHVKWGTNRRPDTLVPTPIWVAANIERNRTRRTFYPCTNAVFFLNRNARAQNSMRMNALKPMRRPAKTLCLFYSTTWKQGCNCQVCRTKVWLQAKKRHNRSHIRTWRDNFYIDTWKKVKMTVLNRIRRMWS